MVSKKTCLSIFKKIVPSPFKIFFEIKMHVMYLLKYMLSHELRIIIFDIHIQQNQTI